jgi:PAS domain S-box-containing protein
MGNDMPHSQTEEQLRKALQDAQASNAKYEQAVSMISDILWRYDVNTKGEYVGSYISPVADRMLGLPVGTIGDSFEKYFSYVHPDDLPLVQETLSEAIRTRENDKTVEYRLRKADGATLWVQSRCFVHGRFSVYGTARDITQQRQAEVALLESAKKYRQLVDTANESIIVAQDGLLKFVNPMTLGLLGVDSEQELIDRPFPEFIHPDDRSMVVENHRRRIANEAFPPRYAFRVVARDGIVKWVEINAALIEWQGKPATLNFLTDITEHKLAEVALQESEERFHTIFENSSAAMAIIERDTTISMVNKEYCKLGLFEKKDVIGISWTSQIPPEDLGRLLEYNRKRLIDPKSAPSKYEFKFYRKDGKILNCLMSVGVIPTTQQIICSFTDITERKETEDVLRRQNEPLQTILDNIPVTVDITDKISNEEALSGHLGEPNA